MVAIPSFLGLLCSAFSRQRQQQSLSDQQLNDVGAIIDDNYYIRDIVIAGKKMSNSPCLQEKTIAVRDIGHIAWLGGPAVAKFASNHLFEFSRMLLDKATPISLKRQTLHAIMEVCLCEQDNQDKARQNGLLETLHALIDSYEECLRDGAVACLVVLVNENYENHKIVAAMKDLKKKLLFVLQDDWRAWKRNEAARLILMLGLNREPEAQPESQMQSSGLQKSLLHRMLQG